MHNTLIRDSEDEPMGIIGTLHDITKRKQEERAMIENEERLSAFMDSATEGILLFDSKLNLIDINIATLRMLGLSREDLIGKNILDMAPDLKETGRYDKYMKVIKTGKPLFFDDLIPQKKYGNKHVELKAFKVNLGLGIILSDITKRMKTEEELKKYQIHLERIIKERTIELQEKVNKLEQYNKLFVGREFRIKELRDRVKELEEQLKINNQ